MKRAAGVLLVTVILLSFTGCSTKVSTDVAYISAVFIGNGYKAVYYEEGNGMLSDLETEMKSAMKKPPQGALTGYMYAEDPETGAMVIEVFVFKKSADADRLTEHLKGNSTFIEGISAIKKSGTVVYMGYLNALEMAEQTG